MGLKVGIVGSRGYPDLAAVEFFVRGLARKHPDAQVVSGGCRDVDITAEQTARECGLSVRSYRPKKRARHYVVLIHETGRLVLPVLGENGKPLTFKTFDEAAFARNRWIAEWVDELVAYWDGRSRGTADTIEKAKAAGKQPHVYQPHEGRADQDG